VVISFPRQPSPACAATQPLPPDATGAPIELPETAAVRRSPVVLVVAAELGVQSFLLGGHRLVPMLLAPFGDRLQPPAEPFTDRLHVHGKLPLSAARALLLQIREASQEQGFPAAEVHYALDNLPNKVLAAEYQTVLPDEKLIAQELERSRRELVDRRAVACDA
jgi:hypothetical protein